MDKEWFYSTGSEVRGPFSSDQMIRLAIDQKINRNTQIIARGMTDWVPFAASDLHALMKAQSGKNSAQAPHATGSLIRAAARRISEMTGETGPVSLSLKDIFSEVFKKHTKEDGEKIFIAGTVYTTPKVKDISADWPKPWLFFRVFLVSMIVYGLLYVCAISLRNPVTLPGLILVGSFAVPFSLVVFFFETNVPRNISIFSVVQMFFVGGTASILVSLFLYSIVPLDQLTMTSAIGVGVIEETGKMLIAAWFIYRLNSRYVLNGLLIGAAIGAGFSAFETAGYVYLFQAFGLSDTSFLDVIFERSWTAVGTHTLWTAIAGAALMIVKQDQPLHSRHFMQRRFLTFFAIAVALHAVWDMPIMNGSDLKVIVLTAIGWFIVLILMNSGLRQVTRMIHSETGH